MCCGAVSDGVNLITSHGHGGPNTLAILVPSLNITVRSETGGAHVAVNTCGGGEHGCVRYDVVAGVNCLCVPDDPVEVVEHSTVECRIWFDWSVTSGCLNGGSSAVVISSCCFESPVVVSFVAGASDTSCPCDPITGRVRELDHGSAKDVDGPVASKGHLLSYNA